MKRDRCRPGITLFQCLKGGPIGSLKHNGSTLCLKSLIDSRDLTCVSRKHHLRLALLSDNGGIEIRQIAGAWFNVIHPKWVHDTAI